MSSEDEPTFEDVEEVRILRSEVYHKLIWSQSELSGDNGEMYIFQWLTATEKKIPEASMVR